MGTLENYRRSIKTILTEYAQIPYAYGDIQIQTVFDSDSDRYLLMILGRENELRVHGCLVHVDIIDEKFANMLDLLQPLIEEIYKEDELHNTLNRQQKLNIRHYYGAFGVMQISKESPEIYDAIHSLSYNSRSVSMTSWKEQGLNAKYLSLKF